MKSSLISELFVVTQTSIYHIACGREVPLSVIKVALNGVSRVEIGSDLARTVRVAGSVMVAIGEFMFVFCPEGTGPVSACTSVERNPLRVNGECFGGHSSRIVAVFTSLEEAQACLAQPNLRPCDRRWWKKSRQALDSVNDDHPFISVIKEGEGAFPIYTALARATA